MNKETESRSNGDDDQVREWEDQTEPKMEKLCGGGEKRVMSEEWREAQRKEWEKEKSFTILQACGIAFMLSVGSWRDYCRPTHVSKHSAASEIGSQKGEIC